MSKENIQERIDLNYLIEKKIGFGGTSNVFLVKEKETNREFVAKVLKEENNFLFDNEINILKDLKQPNNPYIINIINSGEGDIVRNKRKTKKCKYCILEYAVYGDIFSFSYAKNSGFGELYSKVIFSKIMKGIQFCHAHNICHRDIKLQNILLDENFCPKISDFGFACINSPNLKDLLGTKEYTPPEIISNKSYDGKKADIFSLGAVLIILVTGKNGFKIATANDKLYQKIMMKHVEVYWQNFEKQYTIDSLSQEFKDLYIKMISYNPIKRPSVEEILKHEWFKEINEMNEKQMDSLESEIREKFLNLVNTVKDINQKQIEIINKESEIALDNKSNGNNIKKIFNNLALKFENISLSKYDMNNYIIIKGNLDPNNFMNCLYYLLTEEFVINNCYIEPIDGKPKFNAIFEEGEEEIEDEEEITDEIIEKLKKLGIEDVIKKDKENNQLIIYIKLFKYSEGYLLRFVQKKGNRKKFLDKFQIISKLVKNMIN